MHETANNQDDDAAADTRDGAHEIPDPRDTDHPAGDAQARNNQDNEPVA